MEIDNAIFQDLESLGKEKFFKMPFGKFRILFRKILKIFQNGYGLVSY